MRTAITTLLIGTLALSACGRVADSRLNPLNWFGRSTETRATTVAAAGPETELPADGRQLVATVTALDITRSPGGAVVVARGLPPTQGWWDAELVAIDSGEDAAGTLTFGFRIAEPATPTRVSTPQSRELTAGLFLTDQRLEGIRRIVVIGAGNSRSISR